MKIEFKKDNINELLGCLISYGLRNNNKTLIDGCRQIENILIIDDYGEMGDFLNDALYENHIEFIFTE